MPIYHCTYTLYLWAVIDTHLQYKCKSHVFGLIVPTVPPFGIHWKFHIGAST